MTPLIVLAGPTGVGKTALSIALAKEIGAEIISADSMQVYRHMDIGTAKISAEEMQGVKHHLIDILEPTEPFDVTLFQQLAGKAMERILSAGHVPLLVGGTGFYIRALCYDTDFTETDKDPSIRAAYEAYVREGGAEAAHLLHEKLARLDPASADAIPAGNVRRVIRALEYFDKTGEPISAHNRREREKASPYALKYLVLSDERTRLYERINARVDAMMEQGFLEEVRKLRGMGVTAGMTSMQGLGYRELYAHLEGAYPLEEAVAKIKQNTRHFAKRQLTWFRAERDAIFFTREEDADDTRILSAMLKEIKDNL